MASSNLLKEYRQTHLVFRVVLIVQLLLSGIIGYITETLAVGIGFGLIIALPAILLGLTSPTTVISRHVVAMSTQLMAALHIQQTMGMTEMHFQVFVILAFLSFFRDWKVILTGTLVIAVHHISGFVVQHAGGGLIVFEDSSPSFIILLIHASFAIVECVVLSFVANKSRKEADAAILLESTIEGIIGSNGQIHLTDSDLSNACHLSHFNAMLTAVKALVVKAHHLGEELLSFANKVQQSTNALDRTVYDQYDQVSTISAAMRDMTHSIQEVANLSQDANEYANNATDKTQETRSAIEDSRNNIGQLKSTLQTTAEAIRDLSQKCQNISEVMQSIKSVAEQTNLLALNAAIESARAGEHGRGFAVVADEVRNLAIKSKESAEEIEKITSILTDSANHSVNNMENCVDMVNIAVKSSELATSNMQDVLSGIAVVNSNVNHVAGSANAQAKSSASISQSADQLNGLLADEKTQVESLKQDALMLNRLTEELGLQLSKFQIN